MHPVIDATSCPLDGRMFLPKFRDETCAASLEGTLGVDAWQVRTPIPATARRHQKWVLVIDTLDELADWRYHPQVLVADAGYGEVRPFRTGLAERSIPYVVAVMSTTRAHLADGTPAVMDYSGPGPRPHRSRYRQAPTSVRELMLATRKDFAALPRRTGTRTSSDNDFAAMTGRLTATRLRPANRTSLRDTVESLLVYWSLAEWPADVPEPIDCWLTTPGKETSVSSWFGR